MSFQIRRYTEDENWLCFRHAIIRAMQGEDVKEEIDDYDSEYYMGSTICTDCTMEEKVDKLNRSRLKHKAQQAMKNLKKKRKI